MNAFITVIPIILIRYGLLGTLNKDALKRAGLFAPLVGREKVAFWIYQITNTFIIVYLLFLKIRPDSNWFYVGLGIYILGLCLYTISATNYAKPNKNGINLTGLYRISRNPMYVAYFICFLGCFLLTRSYLILAALLVFQISVHVIILSEERWCIKKFGEQYLKYMHKVRRYI